jgi:hypothetical protein
LIKIFVAVSAIIDLCCRYCLRNGLPTGGKKSMLISRIQKFWGVEEAASTESIKRGNNSINLMEILPDVFL